MSRHPARSSAPPAISAGTAALLGAARRAAGPPVARIGIAFLLGAAGGMGIAAQPGEPTLLVAWPGAELARWEDADGVPGRRFIDLCRREGWILRPAELSAEEATGLDRAASEAGGGLFWRGGEGAGGGLLVLGRGEGAVHLRWAGRLPPGDPARLETESRAWLPSTPRMRWEEVAEILDLTAAENRAFQVQRPDDGAFGRLRAAYLRDKTAANLSIYLAGTRRPRALAWSLALMEAFEMDLAPLAEEARAGPRVDPSATAEPSERTLEEAGAEPEAVDASRRRLFALRLLASRSRIYGRCDRILLSLSTEAARGTFLLVDARASADPFVAVVQVGERLGPASHRGDAIARRLEGEASR